MKPEPLVAAIEHVSGARTARGASCWRRAAPASRRPARRRSPRESGAPARLRTLRGRRRARGARSSTKSCRSATTCSTGRRARGARRASTPSCGFFPARSATTRRRRTIRSRPALLEHPQYTRPGTFRGAARCPTCCSPATTPPSRAGGARSRSAPRWRGGPTFCARRPSTRPTARSSARSAGGRSRWLTSTSPCSTTRSTTRTAPW